MQNGQGCYGVSHKPDQSEIRVSGIGGYGSLPTKTRYFPTVDKSVGNAISYISSTINGDSFLINQDGCYAITYCDTTSASASVITMGITVNQSALNSSVDALASTQILATSNIVNTGQLGFGCSAVTWLRRGDVVRAATDAGSSPGAIATRIHFAITQLPCIGF